MAKVMVMDADKLPAGETLAGHLEGLKAGNELIAILGQDPADLLRQLAKDAPGRYDFAPLMQGPTTWRFHFRVRQADEPRSIAAYLGWDHDRLDELLPLALTAATEGNWQECRNRLDEFRHGLFRHIDAEEKTLFPAFEERTGMRNTGPTEVMRSEHIDIRRAVDEMLKAGEAESSDSLEHWHANLLGVLVEHNMKEEQILYPGTDHMLEDEQRDELVKLLLLS